MKNHLIGIIKINQICCIATKSCLAKVFVNLMEVFIERRSVQHSVFDIGIKEVAGETNFLSLSMTISSSQAYLNWINGDNEKLTRNFLCA